MKNIGMIFMALACLILSACHESAPGKVTNELSAAFLTSCSSNADCAEGLKCESGKCISSVVQDIIIPPPGTGCKTEADCGKGQNCANGICIEKVKVECVADADCEEGANCVAGACVRPKPECADNSGCKSGEACNEGKCVALTSLPEGVDQAAVAGAAVGGVGGNINVDIPGGGIPGGDGGGVAPGGDGDGAAPGGGDGDGAGNVVKECIAECKAGFVCINGTCTPTSGPVPGAGSQGTQVLTIDSAAVGSKPKKIGPVGGTGPQETGACEVNKDCSGGLICVDKECIAKPVEKEVENYECEIKGVKGVIGADGECSATVKESPIVQSIGLKIKTANYDGAGTDAIFALKFCKNKTCETDAAKIYFVGKTDGSHFKASSKLLGTDVPPSCDDFSPCSKASLEKGSLDDFSIISADKLFTIEDLKKLDHFEISLVKEVGNSPEWDIQAIEISANTKNGTDILYSSPIVYGNSGYVHSYKSAKFSLKNDLVVVLEVTTANITNAGTDDVVRLNLNYSGQEKNINVSFYKNYLIDGEKKKILVSYSDFADIPTYVPQFKFTNYGDNGWAVEDFKVYIFNPAHNNGVNSDFCLGENCSATTNDKQFWSYHFESNMTSFGGIIIAPIAPDKCFNDDGILWLDSEPAGCSSTKWVTMEKDVSYLSFDDYVK